MYYNEGQDAWFDDKTLSDNPYTENSIQANAWDAGFKDAEWKYNYQTGG